MNSRNKIFKDITDQDIFKYYVKASEDNKYKARLKVKAIIIDENKSVALLKARDHYLLPGGGVEDGESIEDAFRREIMEEVGCNIKNIKSLGTANQYRNKAMKNYLITFFVADVEGDKHKPTTTQEDEMQGVEIVWMPIEDAYQILKSQINIVDENEYNFCFNARSHFEAYEYFYNS